MNLLCNAKVRSVKYSYNSLNIDTKLDTFEIDTLKQFKDNGGKAEKIEDDILSLALANKNEEANAMYNKNLSSLN